MLNQTELDSNRHLLRFDLFATDATDCNPANPKHDRDMRGWHIDQPPQNPLTCNV